MMHDIGCVSVLSLLCLDDFFHIKEEIKIPFVEYYVTCSN